MNTQTNDCDRQRIDEFLNSDHVGLEDADLIKHLDTCTTCRQYMETQAAEPDRWSKATELLRPAEFDHAGSAECSAATFGYGHVERPSVMQHVLASLAPSDDPHRLGRLGGYEISGVVGVGGMGVVLKAVDPALDRIVAIKVMAPHLANNATARKRFSREAKAAAAVMHPNVIPIHCVSSDDKTPYLVMAYIRGGSLQKRLDREGPLTTVEILRVGSQVAAGLAAAHEQGLVHRDIKPENILLEEGVERVTLTDFGLARAVDDASITREGTIAGTPQYMSPEQARGESVDQRSDLFSLGSVLYALCTGRPPFRADTSHGVMRRIIEETPIPIRELNPDIPEWLSDVIEKLMAKEKANRFASARDVHEVLEACLSYVQQPTVARLPRIRPVRKENSKSPILKTLAGVFTMVALFTGLLFAFGILPIAQLEQNGSQEKRNVRTAQDDAESQDKENAYKPTAATKKVIDDLIKEAESKKPQWGDAPAEKRAYWDFELKEAIALSICERLKTLQAGELKDVPQTVNELQGLSARLQPLMTPTESTYNVVAKIAAASWPVVLAGYPSQFNDVLVDLTQPYAAIIVSDKLAEQGRPTEPLGWDVQAAHAIALARAGKIEESLKGNQKLMQKIEINLQKGRLPNQQTEFLGAARSQKSLLMQSQLQKALILAIARKTADSVDASAAAGQVEIENPTQADQPAIQALLHALLKAQTGEAHLK